jgi:hypothetical protein
MSKLGHEQPWYDNTPVRNLFVVPQEQQLQPSSWEALKSRILIAPELLPPELAGYGRILENLTPTSKDELRLAAAGLLGRLGRAQKLRRFYELLENAQDYRKEAVLMKLNLPEAARFRWNYDAYGSWLKANPVAQNTLADYALSVDWINSGKWQPKHRNGYETKALRKAREARRTELMSVYSNEAIGRLADLVRGKQEYRESLWDAQLGQLQVLIDAATPEPIAYSSNFKFVKLSLPQKMQLLREAMEDYKPTDEDMGVIDEEIA